MRNWRPGELELAKTLYYEHIVRPFPRTLDDLAKEYDMSRYRIHRLVMDYRQELGEVVLTASYLRRQLLIEGRTYRQVAKQNCCSVSTVYRKARKYNIQKLRKPGNPNFITDSKKNFTPRT
jgi:Mor family transcriptional regulator